MIGSSKNNRENYPGEYFWTQEKEARVKYPGLSANRPSNNWAQSVFPYTYLISKGFEKWNVFLPEQHAFHPI